MADFKRSALELIGNTPLLQAVNFSLYDRRCGEKRNFKAAGHDH